MKRKGKLRFCTPKKDGGVQKYHYMKSVQNGNRRGVAALYSDIWHGRSMHQSMFWLV